MYVIIWRFKVAAEHREEFVRRYAANGDWARLFGRSQEYLGTELLVADGVSGYFMTIDRWRSQEGWERFKAACQVEYEALDRLCEGLTLDEERIGAGVAL